MLGCSLHMIIFRSLGKDNINYSTQLIEVKWNVRTWNSRRRVALGSSRRITTTTTTITIIATQESELVPVLFPPFGNKKVFSLFFVCVKRNHLCVPNGGFVNGIMAFFPSLFALCYAQLYWPKQKKWFQRRGWWWLMLLKAIHILYVCREIDNISSQRVIHSNEL